MNTPKKARKIGAVIVTFDSQDVITDCLSSLLLSDHEDLQIVIVDNASKDETRDVIKDWAKDMPDFLEIQAEGPADQSALEKSRVVLAQSSTNLGFAGGVNIGLQLLLQQPDVDLFWVLNPDSEVQADTARKYIECANQVQDFGLMGGRTVYVEPENVIQSDGGTVNQWTGICSSFNHGKPAAGTPYPDVEMLDYISGANVVASRKFLEVVGLMSEDYFLYYEEVDWAERAKSMQLVFAKDAIIRHHGGTSIGSPVVGKIQGTAFSNYFNYRARMLFIRKFYPLGIVTAYIYSLLKVIRLIVQGHMDEAHGAFKGLHNLPPPRNVRARLSAAAARIAFKD